MGADFTSGKPNNGFYMPKVREDEVLGILGACQPNEALTAHQIAKRVHKPTNRVAYQLSYMVQTHRIKSRPQPGNASVNVYGVNLEQPVTE